MFNIHYYANVELYARNQLRLLVIPEPAPELNAGCPLLA
jgi:hypothetical protein